MPCAVARGRGERLLDASASRGRAATAPSDSSPLEVVLARRRPSGAARPGTTRRGRSTPRRGTTTSPAGRRRTSPTQWSLPAAARAGPRASASSRAAGSGRRRRARRGRPGRSARGRRRGRRRRASPESGRSRPAASPRGSGSSAAERSSSAGARRKSHRMGEDRNVKLIRSSGILLHPTSLPGGRLGDEAYRFVDWLAAAGQSWWQMLPLGPPDEFGSPYRTPSAFAASPALLAEPEAPCRPAEIEDFVARHPYWSAEWARFAGAGALADQVRFEREWSALRAYARERGVRLIGDVPIYVSDERRRRRRVAGAVRARRGRGRAARSAERERPALGQPAVRLAGAPRDRLPLVDRALRADVRARRRRAHRPLPRLRLLLGDPRAAQDRAARPLAPRPRHRALPRDRARARQPAGDRRGPRRDHAAGLPAARRARPARHGRPPLGVRRQAVEPPRAREPSRELRRVHEHARHRHDGRLVRRPEREGARASCPSTRTSRTGG